MTTDEDGTDEIEAKFLVLERLGHLPSDRKTVDIVQHYLKSDDPKAERRIRKWTGDERTYYFHATKTATAVSGQRREIEKPISRFHYVFLLLFFRDRTCRPIRKKRHIYDEGGMAFEHDVFEGHLKGLETVECEVANAHQLDRIEPPAHLSCRNVTGNPAYSNYSLAKHGRPKVKI